MDDSPKGGDMMATAGQGIKRIVVGLDGSDHAAAALDWAISLAKPIGAEIVAVSALHVPVYAFDPYAIAIPLEYDPEWRAAMKKAFEEEWCQPLCESGLRYRMEMHDGRPASVIAEVADAVDADLVVVGRRGRGGVAELLLGSVSHELSHHCTRPVLLISRTKAAAGKELAQQAREKRETIRKPWGSAQLGGDVN
jgi:nucleotide-binding universal stress UspA family protein